MPKTIDQEYAESAYKAYTELKNSGDKDKIFGYAKKLPMMIINSGLVAAIMFKYKEHNGFHKYFLGWLTGIEPENDKKRDESIKKLLENASSLRYYTSKALRWLFWFNKFADTEKK